MLVVKHGPDAVELGFRVIMRRSFGPYRSCFPLLPGPKEFGSAHAPIRFSFTSLALSLFVTCYRSVRTPQRFRRLAKLPRRGSAVAN